MKYCAFCNTELAGDALFCGNCGMVMNVPADGQTRIIRQFVADEDAFATSPISDEGEEERRRRAALLGIGLIGMDAYPQGSGVPALQGTPQMNVVPTVQGAPQLPGSVPQPVWQGATTPVTPHIPAGNIPGVYSPTPHLPPISSPTLPLHHPQPPPGSSGSSGSAPKHGCAPSLILIAIIVPLIILGSIIGLGLTLFSPGLSLSGSSSVSVGATLSLHGSHFLPGSSISLTRDGNTPVYVLLPYNTDGTAHMGSMHQIALESAQILTSFAGNSSIKADSSGAFNVTIATDASWSAGQHTISATEAVTHRSASLSFTILSPFVSPTPSPTHTATVTPSPSPSPSPSPTLSPTTTAPSAQPGLSCINPTSVALGPVSESYAQAVSANVKLCASGNGLVHWTASWDTSQASWLTLNTTSGQINAPGQSQISVSANAARLAPGTYNATITFSSSSNSTTETLSVSFVVQAGCLQGNPNTLSFTGVASVSDPAAQTVGLTNCGAIGTWSASVKTSDGASWLSVSPTSNTPGGSGSPPENVTISASNLNTQLAAGTYTGSVTFAIGSGTFVVQVTLTVQPAPTLSANTTALVGSQECSVSGSTYICYVTLTNNSKVANLTWTYSAQSIPSLVVNTTNFTIPAGQSVRVQMSISTNDCTSGAAITFTGPANSVNVSWQCSPLIG